MFKTSKFFLIVAVLNVAIVTTSTLFPFIVGKYAWFRSTVDLALIFFLLGILFQPDAKAFEERAVKLFKTPLVIAVSIFVLMFLLACLFGINPSFSFWSNFERGEGGLQILHLYVFFLLLSILFREEKDWRRMLGWFLVAGLLMSFYGFAAMSGWKGFIGARLSDSGFRFQGSIGNPAYVATYLIFIFFYAAYLFLQSLQEKP